MNRIYMNTAGFVVGDSGEDTYPVCFTLRVKGYRRKCIEPFNEISDNLWIKCYIHEETKIPADLDLTDSSPLHVYGRAFTTNYVDDDGNYRTTFSLDCSRVVQYHNEARNARH